MSQASMMADLQTFVGKQIIVCSDDLSAIAARHGYYVNIIDPEFNVGSIDNDDSRLNVRTDKSSVVKSFSIG